MPSQSQNQPLIIAHRGDSRNAPENTLAAFRLALEKGADGVEFDVQLTRDSVPVVIHDFNLRRTGSRPERVSELTSAELTAADAGSWFNRRFPTLARPEYAGEGVPTLTEVLNLVSDCSRIYIELKCDEGDDCARLAASVVEMLKDFTSLECVVVKSFKLAVLPIVKSMLPDVTTAALFAPAITHFLGKKEYLINLAHEAAADELSLHTSLATKRITEAADSAGMPVTIWTTDNPAWLARARRRSIHAVITNDPGNMTFKK